MDREKLIDNFLAHSGLNDFQRTKIPGDASFRHYERISSDGKKYILMDAPPEKEDVKPFIMIDEILLGLNLSAPEIIASDIRNGFLLLEDLGNAKYSSILKENPQMERELYHLAVDVLIQLYHQRQNYNIPLYSREKLLTEAMLVPQWYMPLFNPGQTDISVEYGSLITDIIKQLKLPDEVLVLRDYHADNLMLLNERPATAKVGLLDFQDALMGNPAYDLASLLEDARRDVSDQIQQEMLEYFISRTGLDKSDFMNDYHILAAQRNLKIIGIFSRLKVRDSKEVYLPLIPRVKDYLKKDLKHPSLKNLEKYLIEAGVI